MKIGIRESIRVRKNTPDVVSYKHTRIGLIGDDASRRLCKFINARKSTPHVVPYKRPVKGPGAGQQERQGGAELKLTTPRSVAEAWGMKATITGICALPLWLTLLFSAPELPAQTLTVIHTFGGLVDAANQDGANPAGGMVLSGNYLYGGAAYGGTNQAGVIFSTDLTGSDFTALHSFGSMGYRDEAAGDFTITNADGTEPTSTLALSGDMLYGCCPGGGSLGYGTVFGLSTGGSNFMVLHTFSLLVTNGPFSSPTTNYDGAWPSGLVADGGTLYGTAQIGGTNGSGTVFMIYTNGFFRSLHSFTSAYLVNGPDGGDPKSGLFFTNNMLYGTANAGGANGAGVVFALTNNGDWFFPIYAFPAISYLDGYVNATGGGQLGRDIVAGGTHYGSSYLGGTNGVGTAYAIVGGTNFTLLHTFSAAPYNAQFVSTNAEGCYPLDNFTIAGTTLYGATYFGGTNGEGTIFSMGIDGSSFKVLHTFSALVAGTNWDGASPNGDLVLTGNALYGTTSSGGTNGTGTIFKLALVTTVPALDIGSVTRVGQNLLMNVANGTAGGICTILTTTNLLLPANQWTPVGTKVLNSSGAGSITVTNAFSAPSVRRFYRLEE